MDASLEAVKRAVAAASDGLVERAELVELVVLAAVAREHLLVIGPPGTAKSQAVRRIARGLGGSFFEYLLGRFTEPSEIFGPVDLRKLRDGVVETRTAGMLPEADLAFLDEVFLGSTAILNTLLGVLNERTFRRGHTAVDCPLRVCVGASNDLPEDPALRAFADRFLLRTFVAPLPDPLLEDLLEGGRRGGSTVDAAATTQDLDHLARRAAGVDVAPVRGRLAEAIRTLRKAGIALTDRRAVKTQSLVAAAAVLADRDVATEADLWPLVYAVPTADQQALARDVLGDLLERSANPVTVDAAERASRGPAARAERLKQAGERLLTDEDRDAGWTLKAEGILRELDAAFEQASLPEDLATVRTSLVAAVSPSPEA